MASYTPNYNLKKPADADTYDIADANGNMDLIDTALHSQNQAISTETMGNFNSLSELQSALITLNGTLSNNQFKNITFGMNNADSLFASTVYSGTIIRFSSTRFRVEVGMGQHAYSGIIGAYNNGWEWNSVSDNIANQYIKNSNDWVGSVSVTLPKFGAYLFVSQRYAQIEILSRFSNGDTGHTNVVGNNWTFTNGTGGAITASATNNADYYIIPLMLI